MLRHQQPPLFLHTSPVATRAWGRQLCSNLSNFNYKPQTQSRQQRLVLYMDHHLRSVAIMIEVTSHHTEYIHCNLDYSRMPAASRQWWPCEETTSPRCSWTAASSVKQHKPSSSRRTLTSRPPSNWCLGGNLTYFCRQALLSQLWRGRSVATSAISFIPSHVSASYRCLRKGIV